MIKVKDNVFTVADIDFIKFPEKDGIVPVVAKDLICDMEFGESNNFTESDVLKHLQDKVLPKIEKEIGTENIVEFETDLLSLEGLDTYGKVKSRISLPTFDFYRENVRLFDKYNPGKWWWLATPDSTTEHDEKSWVCCVSPRGLMGISHFFNCLGVRPFLFFVSSIFDSCED